MASKIEVMYTSTLGNTLRLLYLSQYLFLSEAHIPPSILQKLEKEILKQTKELAKSRKKIEESMKKIKPKMYDPMWKVRHPIEVDLKPGRRESKKSKQGAAMKNMKSNELKPFYEAVDGLEKETKELNKFFQFLQGQNDNEEAKKLEKAAKKSKAKGNDHLSAQAHLFNEGALHYLNELFRCARSEAKDINSETQADVFKKDIMRIMNGREALLQAVEPLATGKKPNKFALFVDRALQNISLDGLRRMPTKAARMEFKMQLDMNGEQNGAINNMAELEEQKQKDLEAIEVKPFEELNEAKEEKQEEGEKKQEIEGSEEQQNAEQNEAKEEGQPGEEKCAQEPINVEEVEAEIAQKEEGKEVAQAQVEGEAAVEAQVEPEEIKETGSDEGKVEEIEEAEKEGKEDDDEESDIVPDLDEGAGINVVSVDGSIHTLPMHNRSPVRGE